MKKLMVLLMAMLLVVSTCLMAGCGATNACKAVTRALTQYDGQYSNSTLQQDEYQNVDVALYTSGKTLIFHARLDSNVLIMIHISKNGEEVFFACDDSASKTYVTIACDDDFEVEYVSVYNKPDETTHELISKNDAKYDQVLQSAQNHMANAAGYFDKVVCQLTNGQFCSIRQFLDD